MGPQIRDFILDTPHNGGASQVQKNDHSWLDVLADGGKHGTYRPRREGVSACGRVRKHINQLVHMVGTMSTTSPPPSSLATAATAGLSSTAGAGSPGAWPAAAPASASNFEALGDVERGSDRKIPRCFVIWEY